MTTPAGPGLRRTWRRRFDCDAVSSGKKSRTRRCSRRRAACCTPRAWPSKPMRAGVCGTQRARWIGRAGLCAETTRKRRSIFGVPCATDDGPWSTASSPTAVAIVIAHRNEPNLLDLRGLSQRETVRGRLCTARPVEQGNRLHPRAVAVVGGDPSVGHGTPCASWACRHGPRW